MVGGSHRQGAARWRERLDRWKRSGLTITEFCQREGVSQPSFYSWRKRLASGTATGPRFVPLEVVDGPGVIPSAMARGGMGNSGPAVEVVLPRGVRVKVSTLVDEQQLRGILRAVVAETAGC